MYHNTLYIFLFTLSYPTDMSALIVFKYLLFYPTANFLLY